MRTQIDPGTCHGKCERYHYTRARAKNRYSRGADLFWSVFDACTLVIHFQYQHNILGH